MTSTSIAELIYYLYKDTLNCGCYYSPKKGYYYMWFDIVNDKQWIYNKRVMNDIFSIDLIEKYNIVNKFYKKKGCDIKLIETFQPQAGGKNHFRFKDHPWIHEPINKYLSYDSFIHPPHNHAVPPAQPCGTPTHNHADINKKEIKINTTTTSVML